MFDVLIVGAGPAGLACAIEAGRHGLDCAIVDKGCLANSVYRFPADMTFFSTPELLQIGGLVFVSPSFRPSRMEALHYYRAVADHYGLNIRTYENVASIRRRKGGFHVHTQRRSGRETVHEARRVIVATGYYDNPNALDIEGEDLPNVSHYFSEAHPYKNCDVAVIGAKNSAVEAALALWRIGARVTLIHRGPGISDRVKYWVRPDIDKRLETGQVTAMFNSEVVKIGPESIDARNNDTGEIETLANDFVFALTGYHPDTALLQRCGVNVDPATLAPEHNPGTLETNVPGLHVAGSIVAGLNNNKVFIENSREHGKMIFR